MRHDQVFAISFQGVNRGNNSWDCIPEVDAVDLVHEYDQTTARCLYLVYFLNLRSTFLESNIPIEIMAKEHNLEVSKLAKMYVISRSNS